MHSHMSIALLVDKDMQGFRLRSRIFVVLKLRRVRKLDFAARLHAESLLTPTPRHIGVALTQLLVPNYSYLMMSLTGSSK